jgi:hypothetical protein
VNNTSGSAAGGVYMDTGDGSVKILNSILYLNTDASGNLQGAQLTLASGVTVYDVRYNDIKSCSDLCYDPDDHNIDENPNFVTDTFRLDETSLCIDRGLGYLGHLDQADGVGFDFGDVDDDGIADQPNGEVVPLDLDLNPRFDNGQIDIGCYEFTYP